MLLERSRATTRFTDDPLRLLIWLQATIVALAFAGEGAAQVFHLIPAFGMPAWASAAYFLIALASAGAVFAIPHAPNRRYWAIAFSIAGICATRAFPQHQVLPQTLLITLCARLVFAFGFRGFALAFATEAVSTAGLGAIAMRFEHAFLSDAAIETSFDVLLFVLIFGLVGMTWLYANKASVAAAAAERMRIALDLHDSLGHGLTTLSVQLQNADRLRQKDPEKAAAYVKRGIATANDLLSDVRETVAVLHDAGEATPAPLRILLARLRADFSSMNGLRASWDVDLGAEPSGRVAMALYRIVQEALTNVIRHARATRVDVRLCGDEREMDLSIEDDGCGFDAQPRSGHGLMFMRMRIESMGGRFTVSSREGSGTRLRAVVPLEASA